MMAAQGSSRRGLAWAVVGAVVLLLAIAGIVVSAIVSAPSTMPTRSSTGPSSLTPGASSSSSGGAVVDESVTDRGWTAELITTDPDVYIRAALAAASTFDTTKSSRDDWLSYLDTWLTFDTRYTSSDDQQTELQAAKLELRQGVVLPQSDWDSLAAEKGRVVAVADGDITFVPVSDDRSGGMRIGTADVTMTFTTFDDTGAEASYVEKARVSVQVLCGPDTVPTPNSAQQPGDCKVVRYFTEAMEP